MERVSAFVPGNTAERLIALADASPKVLDWVSLQLKAGRKPSEILADLERSPSLAEAR
ncbi:hypothetical protein [Mesorhizobium sp. M0520]|uniref:hypothetical protein n=1 Tax=Mesorhizobium sp. M0520 TaxID=2956957 RepID=UPI0033381D40